MSCPPRHLGRSFPGRGRFLGSVTHGYDNAFRPKTELVNGGSLVTYGYDADGVLASAAGTWGTLTLTRDAVSGLLTNTSVGTVASTMGYNVHGELTDLDYTKGGAPYFHEHLVRDALGRITQIDETVSGVSTSRTYGYDAAGRLASVTEAGNPSASRGWVYDDSLPGNGNRTLARYAPGVAPDSAFYDVQDRLLRYGNDVGGASYTWTAAGELAQRNRPDQRLTTTYDVLGNLTVATMEPLVSGNQPTGVVTTTTVSYRVDGQNRRVERRLSGPGGTRTQRWLYRDGLAPVAELDSVNAAVNRYVYGTQDHAPDLVVRADGTYRVITDHLGSIRALVNIVTGAVAQRIDYDAWGNETGNSAQALQALGYAGGLTDPDTRFIRFGARDYDPGVGRWTASDPIGFAGDPSNLYRYARMQPMTLVDPSGLAVQPADAMGPLRAGDCRGAIPSHPPGTSVESNISEVVKQANPWWFRNQVKNHGAWDYKQAGYEAFGNFNYGATGAAYGFPAWFLPKQAGAAQVKAGTSRPEFGSPGIAFLPWTGSGSFGDDPEDQAWIKRGIDYYVYVQTHGGPAAAGSPCGCGH